MFVLKRESSKKGFPYDFRAQWLEGCGVIKDSDGIGELRPKMSKTQIHGVFEKVTFMCVQRHPHGLLSVEDGESIFGDCRVHSGSKSSSIEYRGPGRGPKCVKEHPRDT